MKKKELLIIKNSTIMITIDDIIKDMKKFNDTDFYYLDTDNIGYHVHRCWNDTCYYFRYENGYAFSINCNDFLMYITSSKCNLYSVCDVNFYSVVL